MEFRTGENQHMWNDWMVANVEVASTSCPLDWSTQNGLSRITIVQAGNSKADKHYSMNFIGSGVVFHVLVFLWPFAPNSTATSASCRCFVWLALFN